MTTNAPTDPFAETKARYQRAWDDLGERITNSVEALDDLAATKRDAQQVARLRAKAEGLRTAHDLYEALHPVTGTERTFGAHTEAWRTFEDRLAALVKDETDPNVREGLLLANGYQRGYGPGIDAAPLLGG